MRFAKQIPIVIFAFLIGQASAEWARLNDGTIVKVRGKNGDQVAILRSDGTTGTITRSEVDGWLQPNTAIRMVDEVMTKIGKLEHHDFVRQRLKQLGMAAVPQLLKHLRGRELNSRRGALAALQMAWSKEAEHAVSALLTDKDGDLRRMALNLVQRHFPAQEQLRVLRPFATETQDPQIAGPALAAVLGQQPDPETMLDSLKNKALWPSLHPLLPRYQDARFIPWNRRLLKEGTSREKESAVVALIYQLDQSEETRALMRVKLKDLKANLRDLAAEYLRWHGTDGDVAALEKQAEVEKDPYAAASMRAAVETILRRSSNDVVEAITPPPVEPVYQYTETWKLRPDPSHRKRLDALSRALGFPTIQERLQRKQTAFPNGNPPPKRPIARTLVPPVRDYFDPKRKSFGAFIAPGASPFSNSHHLGDDVSFGQQQATVIAIGDGLVRAAEPGIPSWGGLVVVEHQLPDGSPFCSLYGHLGPLICVQPGDRISQGQKLGTLGRDHVFATGGYYSHLHFGIHRGPYGEARWISGYLPSKLFKKTNEHGWLDPQAFLKEHLLRH